MFQLKSEEWGGEFIDWDSAKSDIPDKSVVKTLITTSSVQVKYIFKQHTAIFYKMLYHATGIAIKE